MKNEELDPENLNEPFDAVKSYFVSVPSKTFLVGEYGALLDGPALLINTSPRFEMHFDLNEGKDYYSNPIANQEDPLHVFWNENEDFLLDFDFDLNDPFDGAGGFGASSAEWAAFYAFVHQYQNPFKGLFDKTKNNNDFLRNCDFTFIAEFIEKYRSFSEGRFPPSGYDVISQWIGKIAFIDIKNKILRRLDWPFDDLGFVLIKSAEKILTHEHLKQIEKIPGDEIQEIVEATLKSFEDRKSADFIKCIQDHYDLFQKNGFVHKTAATQVEKILEMDGVLAAKGCGAMGADVFFVAVDMKKWTDFYTKAFTSNLNVIATHSNLSHGFEVQSNLDSKDVLLH